MLNEHIEETDVQCVFFASVSCFVRTGQQKRTERLHNRNAITDTLLREIYHIRLFWMATIDL